VFTDEQWYERFNTKVNVGTAIGVTRQHPVLLQHVAKETHKQDFDACTDDEKVEITEDANERYLSYIFLRQSGKQHNKLRTDLGNDYTTGDDRYAKTRQATLHLLDKYSKTVIAPPAVAAEGRSFAQKGGDKDHRTKDTFDKKYWSDKTCYKCNKKGHPSSHCTTKEKKETDEVSKSSSSSKSSKSSKASLEKLRRDFKKTKKSFATMKTQIEEINKESDISSSDDSGDETDTSLFQYTREHLAPGVAQIFYNKSHKPTAVDTLNLRDVILLDS
jgi:hypothetical protein